MEDPQEASSPGPSHRERVRRFYAALLGSRAVDEEGVCGEGPDRHRHASPELGPSRARPSRGGPPPDNGRPREDPFGDDLFSERVFEGGVPARSATILGEGFEALGTPELYSGDGHGPASGSQHPSCSLSRAAESGGLALLSSEQEVSEDTIFSNPEPSRPPLDGSSLDGSSLVDGLLAGLDALPDDPRPGTRRVIAVSDAGLERLNERIGDGWRVERLVPCSAPCTVRVALRYGGDRGAPPR